MSRPRNKNAPALKPEDREEVKAVYDELEKRVLPRNCQMTTGCCQFRLTRRTPMLTVGEALYLQQGVRASGRREVKARPDGACPLLGQDGRCTAYQHRPFGCRTHFCDAAGGMYPRRHVIDLIQRLEALDEKLGGDGARTLEKCLIGS
jgi:Fe-S-cluster containining protein